MSENLHNIDKLFKNAIEDHDELPSGDLWNNIDKGLDKNKVVSIQRKYYVLKRIAVAVFLFGFVATVFAIYFNSRYYNPQARSGNSSTNNGVRNDRAIVKTNNNSSEKGINNLSIKSNSGKLNQAPVIADDNSSNTLKGTNSITSTSTSNSSDAALSSEDYNKINKETSSSSPSIYISESKKREILVQNMNHVNSSNADKNAIRSNINDKDKKASGSKTLETSESSTMSQVGLRESILQDHLIYSFLPAFSKSFNHIDIAPKTSAPISKLKKQPHVAITVFAGPQKIITHLKDADDAQGMRRGSRDEFRHSEQTRSAVRTGVLFEYPFTSNWSIGSGIIYSSSNTSIDPKVVFARPDGRGNIKYELNCSAGYAYIPAKSGSTPLIGDSAKVFNSKTHISYVSIPVTAGYNLEAGKFILKPSAGILLNFLSTGKVESVISTNSMNSMSSTNSISGLKSSYLSGEINLTAVYQVSNKIGIMVAPGTQFAVTSINKNTSVKTYPGTVGITGGVRVVF